MSLRATVAEVEAHAGLLRDRGFASVVARPTWARRARPHPPHPAPAPRPPRPRPRRRPPRRRALARPGARPGHPATGSATPASTWDGTTRNLVDARGQHRGVALIKLAAGLPEDLRLPHEQTHAGRAGTRRVATGRGPARRRPPGTSGRRRALVFRRGDGYA
ncbi:MAG: hypothetical protein R3F43_27185 [bacterium]